MKANVLLIGSGDVGLQIADGLLRQGGIRQMVLSNINADRSAQAIAMLDCCHDAMVSFEAVDALDRSALEGLLLKTRPDLIIQAASLISPWSIIGRDHPTAKILSSAGIGIQLPAQLPIVISLMQIIRDLGWTIPVANLSMPDIIHPILESRGLAPTIGLGNVSILHLRALAAWKHRHQAAVSCEQPLIRVVGHHRQVYDVMQSTPPHDDRYKVQVYVGNDGERDDDLAYLGEPFPPSPIYNTITAASTLPVLGSLLPGSKPRRFSAPAPFGLPGGYPVKMEHGNVALDLPDGTDLACLTEYNQRLGKLDGVEKIETDGMVHFTETTQSVIRDLDPGLAEPLDPWDLKDRTDRLRMIICEMGPI